MKFLLFVKIMYEVIVMQVKGLRDKVLKSKNHIANLKIEQIVLCFN